MADQRRDVTEELLIVTIRVRGNKVVAIVARYAVGAVVALLVAKGIVDKATAESVIGSLTALVAGFIEYWKARS